MNRFDRIRRFGVGALVAWALQPLAAHAQVPLTEIPCETAPPEAVRTIPSPLDNFVRVVCSNYGHALVSAQGMVWAMLEGQRHMPIALAMPDGETRPLGHGAHFTGIKLVELPVNEQIRMMTLLKNHLPLKDHFEGKVMLLHARANTQAVHRLFFFVVSEEEGKAPNLFGMICSPECEGGRESVTGKPFVVLRMPGAPMTAITATGGTSPTGDVSPTGSTSKEPPAPKPAPRISTSATPTGQALAPSKPAIHPSTPKSTPKNPTTPHTDKKVKSSDKKAKSSDKSAAPSTEKSP